MKFPDKFIQNVSKLLPADQQEDFFSAINSTPPISIRVNQTKKAHYCKFKTAAQVPWEPDGHYLDERIRFSMDPFWHAGAYYVQEASSMIIGYIIKQVTPAQSPLCALDLCAAPGGKSISLLESLPPKSTIICNEIDSKRFQVLKENMLKWGSSHVMCTNLAPKNFQKTPAAFDLILIDAPCSGEGMFRKDEKAIQHWSEGNVISCHKRQREILTDIIPALKPGGICIYSTCTFNAIENECIGDWMIEEMGLTSLKLKVPIDWQFTQREGFHTSCQVAYPHLVKGEGICIQVFIKKQENNTYQENKQKIPHSKTASAVIPSWIEAELPDEAVNFYTSLDGSVYGVPDTASLLLTLKNQLGIKQMPGIEMGEWKGNSFIPAHHIAMSNWIDSYPYRIDLTSEDARIYLTGSGQFNADYATLPNQNWILATYKKQVLGWLKQLSGRYNNYYPKQYRIRNLI
jgi:16S rRNA C967 or C1407 C5-methylase (RsmB/RsmF family)/NOL1/NOP2/fmu family ribosome biogenesis protein